MTRQQQPLLRFPANHSTLHRHAVCPTIRQTHRWRVFSTPKASEHTLYIRNFCPKKAFTPSHTSRFTLKIRHFRVKDRSFNPSHRYLKRECLGCQPFTQNLLCEYLRRQAFTLFFYENQKQSIHPVNGWMLFSGIIHVYIARVKHIIVRVKHREKGCITLTFPDFGWPFFPLFSAFGLPFPENVDRFPKRLTPFQGCFLL